MALADLIDSLLSLFSGDDAGFFDDDEWGKFVSLQERIGAECLVAGITMPPVAMPRRFRAYQPFGFTQIPHHKYTGGGSSRIKKQYTHDCYATDEWFAAMRVLRAAAAIGTDPKPPGAPRKSTTDLVLSAYDRGCHTGISILNEVPEIRGKSRRHKLNNIQQILRRNGRKGCTKRMTQSTRKKASQSNSRKTSGRK